ncbi:MarC family protein [Actinobaculum suis]|nr:MarC family protein [Actinobaculum suis]
MSGSTEKEPTPEQAKVNVALVPLGVPLMAGPGAVVAIMNAVEDTRHSAIGA